MSDYRAVFFVGSKEVVLTSFEESELSDADLLEIARQRAEEQALDLCRGELYFGRFSSVPTALGVPS